MSPKKRSSKNLGLPARWRWKNGAYRYRVPTGLEYLWDGKTEFRLGTKLSDAYRAYAERIESPEKLTMMVDLIDRYSLEVTPDKAANTQKNEQRYMVLLRKVFQTARIIDVEPTHVYQLMDAVTKKSGGTTANHVVGLLSHMFTKAIEWGACRDHPIKNKVIKRTVKVKRKVPEHHQIESALTVANDVIRAYVRLKLMTGARMTDMLSLKIEHLKEDGIHITPSKTQDSSGKSQIILWDNEGHLKAAIKDIRSLKGRFTSMYLFCTRRGKPYIKDDKSCNAFQSMWQRWQNKALKQGLIEFKFSEKSLRNRVGSDATSAEYAAELLAHASTTTTRKHYRNSPVKVLPMVEKS